MGPEQHRLLQAAYGLMPQGVAENYRFWGPDRTVFVQSAKGCWLTDCDGKRYVDFRLGYGPIILGYQDARVDAAVIEQIQSGATLTGFSTPLDLQVVEKIKALCPQIDKVRFANSGTEAVMGAIRTARAFTGRDRVAIVEGGFHGLYDEMMWKTDLEQWDPSSGQRPPVIPFGAGIPEKSRDLMEFIRLNDAEGLQQLFEFKGEELACVILEPIIGNAGSISATPEWLAMLKSLCHQHGALLVLDEVKTGFRVAKGGAQSLYGLHADLTTFAKAMGNGYPVAAFGGRADVMDRIGSFKGGVVHGGTYSANLIALSAANATLDILMNTPALEVAHHVGSQLMAILKSTLHEAGVPVQFAGPPSMFGVHLGESVPTNYRDWRKTDNRLYEKFAWAMIDRGVMLEPDSREPWFLCEAHQTLDLDWFAQVTRDAIAHALKT
ncbi:MAG: aspartate aminotransferase family protein [Betaproteobacteria bacterium]|jgi:glutamate-1-semialdehyde 2,1-aminomutase|nr:aspartate aminotransferase family protein [Betaproteobacteria bacterium]